jgi:hypothetical protein
MSLEIWRRTQGTAVIVARCGEIREHDLASSTMRVEATFPRRMGEQRRYFPDWTALVLETSPELEADRNSYLAGGYAEEFGYRAQPGWSRGVPVLDDESPELCPGWRCQAGATHPGYPLKANPLAAELDSMILERDVSAMSGIEMSSAEVVAREEDVERHGRYIVVSNRVRQQRLRGGQLSHQLGWAFRWHRIRWGLRRR